MGNQLPGNPVDGDRYIIPSAASGGGACTPGCDEKPAFQAAIIPGANVIRILPRRCYFNTPLLIARSGIRLIGSGMGGKEDVELSILEVNLCFSGNNVPDALALIVLDKGADYFEIGHPQLRGGKAGAEDKYADFGIYAKGGKSHQEIHLHRNERFVHPGAAYTYLLPHAGNRTELSCLQ